MAGGVAVAEIPRLLGRGKRGTELPPVVPAAALPGRLASPAGVPPFPVVAALAPVLPADGLRRGSVVAVRGSVSLLFALLAAATADGAWAAVVGVPDLGVLAAAESGVAVQRLALVPRPGPAPAPVVAALLDGIGLVAVAGVAGLSDGARRSLTARARQRGAVLLPLDPWPGADLELTCRTEAWTGTDAGAGRLRGRRVLVRASGRGGAVRSRAVRVLLPGPGGPAVGLSETGLSEIGVPETGVPEIGVPEIAVPEVEFGVRAQEVVG